MIKNNFYIGQVVYCITNKDTEPRPSRVKIHSMGSYDYGGKLLYTVRYASNVLEKPNQKGAEFLLREEEIFNTELEAINSVKVVEGKDFYTFTNDPRFGPKIIKRKADRIDGDMVICKDPMVFGVAEQFNRTFCFRTEKQLHNFLNALKNSKSPNFSDVTDISDALRYLWSGSMSQYTKPIFGGFGV